MLDDAAEIARVQTAGWREGYAGLVPDDALAGRDEAASALRWRDTVADVDVLVAEARGHPGLAGFAALAVPARELEEPGVGEITALYVDPTRWRGSVGRALVDAVAAELREQGCDIAVAWCLEGNARGLGFYAALGFAPDGGRQTFHDLPEVRLRARLD